MQETSWRSALYVNYDGDEDENLRKLLAWCWRQGTFEKMRVSE